MSVEGSKGDITGVPTHVRYTLKIRPPRFCEYKPHAQGVSAFFAALYQMPKLLLGPKLQSTVPAGVITPATCLPMCLSSAGRHGTS